MSLLTPELGYVLILSMLTVAVLVQFTNGDSTRGLHLPPGPKPVPLLGNVHQLSATGQHTIFADWGRRYGDVVFAKLFQTPAIILNSSEAAQDLLDKKGVKYSHRPRFVLLSDLMGWDCVITHMTYGDRFRKHRRWIAGAFQDKDTLRSYRPVQRREAYTLVSGFFQTPELFRNHIRRFAAASIMEITYGHSVTSLDDKFVCLAERATTETIESGSAGSMIVDFFPSLRHIPTWMPGAGFKRRALKVRTVVRNMLDDPFHMVKDAFESGTVSQSFTASLLEEVFNRGNYTKEDEDDIKGAAGVLYGAATDTTVAVLSTFMLAMVQHPKVYKKAQVEMDRVIGVDRLPDFGDRESLSYLECVIREVFRWKCPVPLGLPHATGANDTYRGYDIPEGSTVIPNIWAMTQDEELYPDPEAFRPERFVEMSKEIAEARDPRNVVFGFGRRTCPGQGFADASIWIAVATVIATVNICKTRDRNGKEITPSGAFCHGFVSHPQDFECSITPRSQRVMDIVSDMIANIVV